MARSGMLDDRDMIEYPCAPIMGSVGAGNECPAGPDAGPHGSSSNQQNALYGAAVPTGFRAVPLVHIASPSPSMRIALRRNLVPAEPVGSGRDRTVVVMAPFGRERHRGQLELVLDRLALEHSARPAAQGVVMPFAGGERGAGAHDQKLAQIAVAHLGDPPEPRLAAGRMLTRGQPEEGGELPSAGKCGE